MLYDTCWLFFFVLSYIFPVWLLVPFQVSVLSDPKIKSGLWSVFVTTLLICGAYFVGSAVLAKDFREVHMAASIHIYIFMSLKKRFYDVCDLLLMCRFYICLKVFFTWFIKYIMACFQKKHVECESVFPLSVWDALYFTKLSISWPIGQIRLLLSTSSPID